MVMFTVSLDTPTEVLTTTARGVLKSGGLDGAHVARPTAAPQTTDEGANSVVKGF